MRILALDSSGLVASVAVVEGAEAGGEAERRVVSEVTLCQQLTHSQVLMPMVEEALENAQLSLGEMEAFAVAVGPGSFTGLRIGIATAKALAMAAGRGLIPVNTLDALAANVPLFPGRVCPIMDARRHQVYTALYQNGARIMEPGALALEELCDRLEAMEDEGPLCFLGDGVPVYGAWLRTRLPEVVFAPAGHALQRAALVGLCALDSGRALKPVEVDALYLRSSQAQESQPKFAGLPGL